MPLWLLMCGLPGGCADPSLSPSGFWGKVKDLTAPRRGHCWANHGDGAGRFCQVWGLQGLPPWGKAG